MRYKLVEIEGHLTTTAFHASPGMSCHVLDTLYAHRCVASFRTETSKGIKRREREAVRADAQARCDELNRAHEEAVAA